MYITLHHIPINRLLRRVDTDLRIRTYFTTNCLLNLRSSLHELVFAVILDNLSSLQRLSECTRNGDNALLHLHLRRFSLTPRLPLARLATSVRVLAGAPLRKRACDRGSLPDGG